MKKLGEIFIEVLVKLNPLKQGLAKALVMTKAATGKLGGVTSTAGAKIAKSLASFATGALKGVFHKAYSIIRSQVTKIVRLAKTTAIAIGAAFAAFSAYSVKLAIDVKEADNLFEVTFGNMTDSVRAWSDEFGKALGINSNEIRKYTGNMAMMLSSMGLSTEEAAKLSMSIVDLSYNVSSFRNLSPEEAFHKITSGLMGMPRPLKEVGILLDDNAIKTYALSKGLIQTGQEMSGLQKVLARYGALLQQTTLDLGDLVRTQHEAANVIRAVKSQIKETAQAIGLELLPAVLDIALAFKEWLVDHKQDITDWFVKIWNTLQKTARILWNFGKFMKHDFPTAWRVGFDAVVDTLISFGRVAVLIAKQIGKEMWEALKPTGGGFMSALGKAPLSAMQGMMKKTYGEEEGSGGQLDNDLAKIEEMKKGIEEYWTGGKKKDMKAQRASAWKGIKQEAKGISASFNRTRSSLMNSFDLMEGVYDIGEKDPNAIERKKGKFETKAAQIGDIFKKHPLADNTAKKGTTAFESAEQMWQRMSGGKLTAGEKAIVKELRETKKLTAKQLDLERRRKKGTLGHGYLTIKP